MAKYKLSIFLVLLFSLGLNLQASVVTCPTQELFYFPSGNHAFELNQLYQRHLPQALDEVRSIFSASLGKISGRPKLARSVLAKLTQKQERLGLTNIDLAQAKQFVGDGLGSRLTLSPPINVEKIETMVTQLVIGIRERKIVITQLHNYHGPGVTPYLNDDHILRISQAVSETNGNSTKFIVTNGDAAIRESGYTGININIAHQTSDGIISGEMQVRGTMVGELASVEHFVYDVKRSKPLAPEVDTPQLRQIADTINGLSQSQALAYQEYLQQMYAYARYLETLPPNAIVSLNSPIFPRDLARFPSLRLSEIKRLLQQAKHTL